MTLDAIEDRVRTRVSGGKGRNSNHLPFQSPFLPAKPLHSKEHTPGMRLRPVRVLAAEEAPANHC